MLRTEIEQLKWSSIKFWCYKWVCDTDLAPELSLHEGAYTQEKFKSSRTFWCYKCDMGSIYTLHRIRDVEGLPD